MPKLQEYLYGERLQLFRGHVLLPPTVFTPKECEQLSIPLESVAGQRFDLESFHKLNNLYMYKIFNDAIVVLFGYDSECIKSEIYNQYTDSCSVQDIEQAVKVRKVKKINWKKKAKQNEIDQKFYDECMASLDTSVTIEQEIQYDEEVEGNTMIVGEEPIELPTWIEEEHWAMMEEEEERESEEFEHLYAEINEELF